MIILANAPPVEEFRVDWKNPADPVSMMAICAGAGRQRYPRSEEALSYSNEEPCRVGSFLIQALTEPPLLREI